MSKNLFYIISPFRWILIIYSFQLLAQPPIDWQYTYGGSCAEVPQGRMIQTSDGGYAVFGLTWSDDGTALGGGNTLGIGNQYFWVIKLDKNGAVQWQKCLGGSGADVGTDIIQTSTGGYLVVGYIGGTGGQITNCYSCDGLNYKFDFWAVMLDPNGTIQWEKNYGGTESDRAEAVKETSDGNFVIAGWTGSNNMDVSGFHPGASSDMWVIKINPAGTLLWQKALGGNGSEEAYDIIEADNGDYIAVGRTNTGGTNGDVTGNHPPAGRDDAWVVRLNPNTGAKIWAKCYGGSILDYARSVVKSNDGNFVIAGVANSHDGDVTGAFGSPGFDIDSWVFKIDNNGTLLWQRRIGGSGDEAGGLGGFTNIEKACDDGFILFTGSSSPVSYDKTAISPSNNNPVWMIRLTADGSALWDRVVGSAGGFHFSQSGIISKNGSYFALSTASGIGGHKTVPNYSPSSSLCLDQDIWLVRLAYTIGFTNTSVCFMDTTAFTDTTTNTAWNAAWRWDFGDPASGTSNTSNQKNPKHSYSAPGNYQAMLISTKDCTTDTLYKTVVVNPVPVVNVSSPTICDGDSAVLYISGSTSQSWSTGVNTTSITVYPTITTQYTVTATNGICSVTVSTTVTIVQKPVANAGPDSSICQGSSIVLNASGGGTYTWNTNPSLNNTIIQNPTATPEITTTYTVAVSNGACSENDAVTITIFPLPSAEAGNDVTIQEGENTILSATGGVTYSWSPSIGLSCIDCQSPKAKPNATTKYYVIAVDANGCTSIDSVMVSVEGECKELFLPTAFSPNDDGQNDILYIMGTCIKKIALIIYNRWGEKVFETDNSSQGWDGYSEGIRMGTDLFFYSFEAELTNGDTILQKGNFSLIR